MTATLATLRDRVELALMDSGNTIWSTSDIDEGLRQALEDYSRVLPDEAQGTVTLAADGREVSLSTLTGLLQVLDVWWPYDSTQEVWPPNKVTGWRVYYLAGVPTLYFLSYTGSQPQSGEKVRVWYTKLQTLEDLDSAAATTFRADHESLIAYGAAGKAAMARALNLIETASIDLYEVGLLAQWGKLKLKEFNYGLDQLRSYSVRRGRPWMEGWKLDKWDA
ncbi:MAG: hypothetical protein ACK2UW_09280 [Anaerolineales bacterium]